MGLARWLGFLKPPNHLNNSYALEKLASSWIPPKCFAKKKLTKKKQSSHWTSICAPVDLVGKLLEDIWHLRKHNRARCSYPSSFLLWFLLIRGCWIKMIFFCRFLLGASTLKQTRNQTGLIISNVWNGILPIKMMDYWRKSNFFFQ